MKVSRAVLGCLAFASCAEPSDVEIAAGDGTRVQLTAAPFSLRILDASGHTRLETLGGVAGAYGAPGAVADRWTTQDRFIPGWDGYTANEGSWRHAVGGEIVDQEEGRARVVLDGEGVHVELDITVAPGRVRVRQRTALDEESGQRFIKSGISFVAAANEHFFGLGERYASVDHRGLSLYSWTEEAGVGQGENAALGPTNPYPNGPSMTYFPVPFFLSSAGYGLHVATTFRSEVHLASEREDALRIAASTDDVEFVVYTGSTPLQILDAFTADTGRPPVPAPWVFGPRRRSGSNSMVRGMEEWRLLRQRGVPTTAIDDAVHFLPHNSHAGNEDTLRNWTSTLHAQGFKAIAYNNPYVSASDEAARAEYEYGRERGYFVRDETGAPGLTVFVSGKLQSIAAIDVTNPDATEWFQTLLRRTLALGYDGWMHDFGEYVARDWQVADGRRGHEVHNLYPVLSAKAAWDLLTAEKPGDFLFFVRAGYTGTQAYVPAVWGGDPEATFDETQGLPASLRGGLNLALSGVPYWGSDIGGFKCFTEAPRDKEVYLRWAELGAVSPIMHDQDACVSLTGQRPKWGLWSDDETTRVYGDMARLHTRLAPYFLLLAHEAHATGLPLMRHPFLLFPEDSGVWSIEDGFFLGPSLYAWPVVRRGERQKRGYLPSGVYVDWTDLRVYRGGQEVMVPAPLDKIPLFLVADRLVPLLDASIETLATATDPAVVTPERVADVLDVRVALSVGGQAQLTLADGTVLSAERVVADAGLPAEFVQTATTALAACSRCVHAAREGDVARVRVNSHRASDTSLELYDLRLTARGGPSRRIRWDVARLD